MAAACSDMLSVYWRSLGPSGGMVTCAGEISSKLPLAQQPLGRSPHARSSRRCRWSGFSGAHPPRSGFRSSAASNAVLKKWAMSRAKMSPSNTVGRMVNMIDCRRWPPIWFADRWPLSLRQGRPLRPSPRRQRRRLYRSSLRMVSTRFNSGWSRVSTSLEVM